MASVPDGRSGIDAAKHFYILIKKDDRRAVEWQKIDERCRASGAVSEYLSGC
jgi:hypothetical protein